MASNSEDTRQIPEVPGRPTSCRGTIMEFLTVTEVATALHMRRKTVREFITKGNLKAIKVGRYYRIRKDDLERWITDHAVVQA